MQHSANAVSSGVAVLQHSLKAWLCVQSSRLMWVCLQACTPARTCAARTHPFVRAIALRCCPSPHLASSQASTTSGTPADTCNTYHITTQLAAARRQPCTLTASSLAGTVQLYTAIRHLSPYLTCTQLHALPIVLASTLPHRSAAARHCCSP
jgi:hypothetical protein